MFNPEYKNEPESPLSQDERVLSLLRNRRAKSSTQNTTDVSGLKSEISSNERAVAEIIQSVYLSTTLKPDSTTEELLSLANELVNRNGLDDDVKAKITEGITEYTESLGRVKSIKNGELRGNALYEDIFGVAPVANPEISFNNLSVVITVDDADFEEIAKTTSKTTDPENEKRKKTHFLAGQAHSISVLNDLTNGGDWKYTDLIVVVRKGTTADTVDHEEQHKYTNLFRASKRLYMHDVSNIYRGGELVKGLDKTKDRAESQNINKTIKETAELVTKSQMRMIGSKIQSEILSYYRESPDRPTLPGEFVDYYLKQYVKDFRIAETTINRLNMFLSTPLKGTEGTVATIERYATDYLAEITRRMLRAANTLVDKNYPKEMIINMLQVKPAEDWPSLARRQPRR